MNAEPSHELAARDRELAEIAKSIASLAELFKDLSVLVIDQGTLLDSVEYNIEQTAVQMEDAVTELKIATGWVIGRHEVWILIGSLDIKRTRANGNVFFSCCLSSLASLSCSSLNPNDITIPYLRHLHPSRLHLDLETLLHLYHHLGHHDTLTDGLDYHRLFYALLFRDFPSH